MTLVLGEDHLGHMKKIYILVSFKGETLPMCK